MNWNILTWPWLAQLYFLIAVSIVAFFEPMLAFFLLYIVVLPLLVKAFPYIILYFTPLGWLIIFIKWAWNQ